MPEGVAIALVTGGLGLAGVVVTALMSRANTRLVQERAKAEAETAARTEADAVRQQLVNDQRELIQMLRARNAELEVQVRDLQAKVVEHEGRPGRRPMS